MVKSKIKLSKDIHPGKFGGKGTFKSLNSCKAEVRKQKRAHVPKAKVIERINVIKVFNSRKNPSVANRAKKCMAYAEGVYA